MNKVSVLSTNVTKAAKIIQEGGLVAFPTETVYGLGADARNPEAVKRIFEAKGRPSDHPLIIHIAKAEQMSEWAQDIPQLAWQLAEVFWPGPLTLILPRADGVPDAVTGGLDTVALRVPGHPIALELLKAFRGGIAAPSANRYGCVSPTSAEDVKEELKDRLDLILDGGRCPIGIESTIVDLSTEVPRLLRPGKVTAQMLETVIGRFNAESLDKPMQYPGSKPSHYAPRARVILASFDDVEQKVIQWHEHTKRVGLLSTYLPHGLPKNITWLRLSEEVEKQSYELYHSLRHADHLNVDILVAVMPADEGIGHAVRDRLRRAAGLGEVI